MAQEIQKNKITIHRALSYIKSFPDNINEELQNQDSAALSLGGNKTNLGDDITEFQEKANKAFKSLSDKMDYLTKVKVAINESNTRNFINVPRIGEVSIAEVITMKTVQLPLWTDHYKVLRTQYNNIRHRFEKQYNEWSAEINNLNATIEADKDNKVAIAVLEEKLKAEPKLVVNVDNMEALEEKIIFFRDELDFLLSEHNIATFIEI